MIEKIEEEAIKEKTTELLEILREAGFSENMGLSEVIGNRVVIKVIADIDSETFNERVSLLSGSIMVWPSWVGTVETDTREHHPIDTRCARNPSFGINL